MSAAAQPGKAALLAASLASAAILASVFTAQYGFDLWPCSLCYMQRVPHFFVAVFGALSLMPAIDGRTRRVILFHLVGLFILSAALGGYHAGVEAKWWPGPDTCTGIRAVGSMTDVLSGLTKAGQPGCDEVAFAFMGISLAGYNLIASIVLAAGSLYAALRKDWWA